MQSNVRVAAVQFQAQAVDTFDAFIAQVEYFVETASKYEADFILFPELFTMPLLSIRNESNGLDTLARLDSYTTPYNQCMRNMAIDYKVNIIGGSHLIKHHHTVQNMSTTFLRDGQIHHQSKLHTTPNEKNTWQVEGGDTLSVIDTDCGPIGILICYDTEFPEAARYLTDKGAQILFVPFCTDSRQGYQRVRYCAQARAVENQVYVAMAGLTGNLRGVDNMDIHYAESAILTPCDYSFPLDGIAALACKNIETMILADLDLTRLETVRQTGTVTNLQDRRLDLYHPINWKK